LAPEVDVATLRALRLDELEPPLDGTPDRLLVQVRVDDDHDFVRPNRGGRHQYLLWTAAVVRAPLPAPPSRMGAAGAGSVGCEPVKASRSPRTNLSARTLHAG